MIDSFQIICREWDWQCTGHIMYPKYINELNDEYAEKYAEYVCLGDDEDAQKQFALIHERFL